MYNGCQATARVRHCCLLLRHSVLQGGQRADVEHRDQARGAAMPGLLVGQHALPQQLPGWRQDGEHKTV